jgi:hypothetical protein
MRIKLFILLFCLPLFAQDLTEVRYQIPATNYMLLQGWIYKQQGNLAWIETTNAKTSRCGAWTHQGPGTEKNTLIVDVQADDFMHQILQGKLKGWADYAKANDKKSQVIEYVNFTNTIIVVKTNSVSTNAPAKKDPPSTSTIDSASTTAITDK